MSIWKKSFMFRNSVRDCINSSNELKFYYDEYINNYDLILKYWERAGVVFPYSKDISYDEFREIWFRD